MKTFFTISTVIVVFGLAVVPGRAEVVNIDNSKPPVTAAAFSKDKQAARAKEIRGGVNGGGGDEVGIFFQKALTNALENVKNIEPVAYKKLQERGLNEVLETLLFITTTQELEHIAGLVTQSSTSGYDRENRIVVINRNRWLNIRNERAKEALALHEIGGILGIESTGNYKGLSALYAGYRFNIECNSLEEVKASGERFSIRITILGSSLQDSVIPGFVGVEIEQIIDGKGRHLSQPKRDGFGSPLIVPFESGVFQARSTKWPLKQSLWEPSVPEPMEEAPYILDGRHTDLAGMSVFTVMYFKKVEEKFILYIFATERSEYFGRHKAFHCKTVR